MSESSSPSISGSEDSSCLMKTHPGCSNGGFDSLAPAAVSLWGLGTSLSPCADANGPSTISRSSEADTRTWCSTRADASLPFPITWSSTPSSVRTLASGVRTFLGGSSISGSRTSSTSSSASFSSHDATVMHGGEGAPAGTLFAGGQR